MSRINLTATDKNEVGRSVNMGGKRKRDHKRQCRNLQLRTDVVRENIK